MGLFRRRRAPLHEQLARAGGLTAEATPPDPRPQWQETGIHGLQRPREWDVTVTADAPELEGDAARFVTLPDGSLLVEDGPEGSLEPLAAAVEQRLRPPYRARAARQEGGVWAVQARAIEVLPIPDGPDGEAVELIRTADGTTVSVDDARVFGSIPALERRGEQEGSEFVVRAERLDGDLWEVRAEPL